MGQIVIEDRESRQWDLHFSPISTINTSELPVIERRISQVIREARGETLVGSREPEKLAADRLLAKKLIPFINRETVKQTIMTSVYGVTFVGARQQIQNRLQESKFDEDLLYDASIYLAKLTLSSCFFYWKEVCWRR